MNIVLDTYAILAYIGDEVGAEKVEKYLHMAKEGKVTLYMNYVNLGEIYYILARQDLEKADLSIALLKREPIVFIQADEKLSLLAGRIKAFHKLSYADAFVVATAIETNSRILTGDEEFKRVEDKVEIEWL